MIKTSSISSYSILCFIISFIGTETLLSAHSQSEMYKYYYCNHTDKIHRTATKSVGFTLNPNNGNKAFYVNPLESFSEEAIKRTIPCEQHYKQHIPFCLVPVEQYQH
eukprot:468714_1